MNNQIESALTIAAQYGQVDGAHHKAWVIDQMVRALTNCPIVKKNAVDFMGNCYEYFAQGESEEYCEFITKFCDG